LSAVLLAITSHSCDLVGVIFVHDVRNQTKCTVELSTPKRVLGVPFAWFSSWSIIKIRLRRQFDQKYELYPKKYLYNLWNKKNCRLTLLIVGPKLIERTDTEKPNIRLRPITRRVVHDTR